MAQWINQTLHVNESAEIILFGDQVFIGSPDGENPAYGATFCPTTREQANAMSVVLKMAAKRLEDIGKGM